MAKSLSWFKRPNKHKISTMLILVADSMKEGMVLRELFPDFETIQTNVAVHGLSIWVKPYDPTPLLVFNPSHQTIALGEIIQAPNTKRFLDYVLFTHNLYPYYQDLIFEAPHLKDKKAVRFFYSQHSMPDLESQYGKLDDGTYSQEVYESLWSDAIADEKWLQ